MKALTIWQPYAQAIALGIKKYETRSWATKYRGKIAIHASVKNMSKGLKALAEKLDIKEYTTGAIIATATLTDCIRISPSLINEQNKEEIELGLWQEGFYAWKLENIEILDKPIKTSGKQGLWNWIL